MSTELQNVLEDIIANSTTFFNTGMLLEFFAQILQKAISHFERPITLSNDNENALFAEVSIIYHCNFSKCIPNQSSNQVYRFLCDLRSHG